MKSGNIFVNLSQYFVLIAIALVGLLLLTIAGFVVKSKRDLIKEKIKKFKEDFFFNGLIKSLNLSYLSICVAISASVQSLDVENTEALLAITIVNVVLLLLLFSIPIGIAYHSLKNSETFIMTQKEDLHSNVKNLFQ